MSSVGLGAVGLLETIFDILPSGLILWDESVCDNRLQINQKGREILGLEILTLDTKMLPAYLDELMLILSEEKSDIPRSEITLQIPGREEATVIGFNLKQIPSTLENHSGNSLLKVFTFSDITQVLKDRVALDKIKDELHQSKHLASMGTMIAGVAHELNNPLTGISMGTSLVKMNLERLMKLPDMAEQSKIKDSLDKVLLEITKIARSTEKASILVDDLRDYTKPGQLILEPVVLQEFVDETIQALKTNPHFTQCNFQMASQVSLPMEASIESNDNPWIVLGDRIKLEQVLFNLIQNACDATDGKASIRIFYTTRHDDRHHKRWVILHVCDNGPGIDKGVINRVFDPFFTTKGHNGMGLGLSICYKAIEQHGGQLSVESLKGEGTDFQIALPIQDGDPHSGACPDG